MTRRRLVRAIGAGCSVVLTGCLSDDSEKDSGDENSWGQGDNGENKRNTPVSADEDTEGDKQEEELPITGEEVPELAAFDEMMVDFMNKRGVKAGALGVARDGDIVFERGYGWKDPNLSTPLDPDSLFRIASISKRAVVQKASQGSGRTNLMCPAAKPSYRTTIRSHRFSKLWRQRQQHFLSTLISCF